MHKYGPLSPVIIVALLAVGCGGGGGGGGDGEEITVEITAPSDGATYDPGDQVLVEANVTKPDGVNVEVKFYIDDEYKDHDLNGPDYQYDWDTTGLPEREYTIRVTAYDMASPQDSGSDTITVNLGASQFTVYAGPEEVAAGGIVTVSVYMKGATATPAGYQMTVEYDEELELANGADSVSPGEAVPAAPDYIIAKNVSTLGQIRVAVVGWDDTGKQIRDFLPGGTEVLNIDLRATGSAGDAPQVRIISTPADGTPLELWTRTATELTPAPATGDGTVTIQ